MMNLPFYLHQIFLKVVASTRKRRVWYPHDVYHHGLIKLLYTHELNKKAQQPRRTLGHPFPRRQQKKKIFAKEAESSQGATGETREKPNRGKNKLLEKQKKNIIGEKNKLMENKIKT